MLLVIYGIYIEDTDEKKLEMFKRYVKKCSRCNLQVVESGSLVFIYSQTLSCGDFIMNNDYSIVILDERKEEIRNLLDYMKYDFEPEVFIVNKNL